MIQVGVGVDGIAGAGMLHDPDLHLALFAESERLLDGELLAQVQVIVRDREGWLGGRRGCEQVWCGSERGSCDDRSLKKVSARIGMLHSLSGILQGRIQSLPGRSSD